MRRHWLPALVLTAAIVAAAACSSGSENTASPSATPSLATFEATTCSANIVPAGQDAGGMRCGFVTVPEDRTRRSGRTIRLAIAVIKATGPQPVPDPLLYLSGGPGQPNLADNMQGFTRDAVAPVQATRDLVFFDQRGTGLSTPSLTCPEVTGATRAAFAADLSNVAQAQGAAAALRACHDRLQADVDFTAYSSKESAADIVDVMHALGYDTYNIYGLSYGTRLALEAMRDEPRRIRSVVLDSTLPPQARGDAEVSASFQRSVETLLAGCKADAACSTAYPDLEQVYFGLVAKAGAAPIVVEPKDPATGETTRVVVNGDRILAGSQQAFYQTNLLPLLPFAVKAISSGNTAILEMIAQQVAFTANDYAQAMQTAANCNDVTMRLTVDDVAQATKGVRPEILAGHLGIVDAGDLKVQQELCRAFGITRTDPGQAGAVTSDIPTLIFSGEYDPITPPAWGRLAARTLSHGSFVSFPGSGHGLFFGRTQCAVQIAAAFLAEPSAAPDHSCADALGEPKFLAQ
jgi:pimeloyl-ACP methyl ester carboxylesterase